MIGNNARSRRRVRLRLRNLHGWYFLSRDPLGWVGPYETAEDAYGDASKNGHLWRDEELKT